MRSSLALASSRTVDGDRQGSPKISAATKKPTTAQTSPSVITRLSLGRAKSSFIALFLLVSGCHRGASRGGEQLASVPLMSWSTFNVCARVTVPVPIIGSVRNPDNRPLRGSLRPP